jgi:deoxyadenosine/deoxycytidine kinase
MIFTIEGNIGAGKTTLLNDLALTKFSKDHIVVLEPIDTWMDCRVSPDKPSLFEMYYKNREKYAFTFQLMAMHSRAQNLIEMVETSKTKVVICERNFLTDYEIFAKIMFNDGFINDVEMMVYRQWHTFIMDMVKPYIAGTIYLRANPEVCTARINKRGRKDEVDNIDLKYMYDLHFAHEVWLAGDDKTETVKTSITDVLIIDANVDGKLNTDAMVEFIEAKLAAATATTATAN